MPSVYRVPATFAHFFAASPAAAQPRKILRRQMLRATRPLGRRPGAQAARGTARHRSAQSWHASQDDPQNWQAQPPNRAGHSTAQKALTKPARHAVFLDTEDRQAYCDRTLMGARLLLGEPALGKAVRHGRETGVLCGVFRNKLAALASDGIGPHSLAVPRHRLGSFRKASCARAPGDATIVNGRKTPRIC